MRALIASQKWAVLIELSQGSPCWSRDGLYLYFHSFDVHNPEFWRVQVSNAKREPLATINFRRVQAGWYWWNGLITDGSPVALWDESTEEVYPLDWEAP